MPKSTTTYWDYLHLLPLLELQGEAGGRPTSSPKTSCTSSSSTRSSSCGSSWCFANCAMARDRLMAEWVPEKHLPHIVRHLRRVIEIFKLSIDSFGVLETLTPQDFLAFRKKLGESSGFQSFQMRQMELLLGWQFWPRLGRSDRRDHESGCRNAAGGIDRCRPGADAAGAIAAQCAAALAGPHADSGLISADAERCRRGRFVHRRVSPGAGRVRFLVVTELDQYTADSESRRARVGILFIESYRDLPLLSWPYVLIETVVEMEEQLVLWRTRHARMVERMIGRRRHRRLRRVRVSRRHGAAPHLRRILDRANAARAARPGAAPEVPRVI